MRLDWNDIRARAAKFADEWKDAHYESGETQTFYNEFFELFGVTRRRVASFEHGVDLPDNKRGYLDLFWKGKLLVEQKSRGRDLKPARKQAYAYFPGLKEHELPRYILLSDFQTFELYDLDLAPDTPVTFRLSELPDHVQNFGFIVGQEKRIFRDQDPANIQASEMMGALHDALEASGYKGHALERFLVRLLFCLFADDTGIFQPLGIFEDYVKNTREDGADVGPALGQLFQVLNTPKGERHKLSKLTFFDPACGCGNFLVIAYRELRDLEIALLNERFGEDKTVLDIASLSTINVDQFYGIEIE